MILQRGGGGALRIFSDDSLLLVYICGGSFRCPFMGILPYGHSEGGGSF